jgi:hypothetical protein
LDDRDQTESVITIDRNSHQNLSPQLDALKTAGCTRLFASKSMPRAHAFPSHLTEAIAAVKQDDTLLLVGLPVE